MKTSGSNSIFVLTLAVLLLSFMTLVVSSNAAKERLMIFVGTYTDKGSKGIYAYRFEVSTGTATPLGLAVESANPSFLAVHPNQRLLYAVNETSNYEGQKAGSISAYSIDPQSGHLAFLNSVSSRGDSPCHLSVDRTGKLVVAANYGGGSIAAFPLKSDGSLNEASAFVQHKGSSVDKARQEGPHAHSASFSPDNRFALFSDLGLDRILVYRLDISQGTLKLNDPPFGSVKAGSGPRHLAFHPNGHLAYEINEMVPSITVFSYDSRQGVLKEIEQVSAQPDNYTGTNNSGAEVVMHPSGRFLYASNRGADTIAVFAIDPQKGTLSKPAQVSTQGKTPRNFAVDPTGAYLLAANQGSDTIVVFRIDQKTGMLSPTGTVLSVKSPVCVVFADAE
jgi:6-phosphogluconolactonase